MNLLTIPYGEKFRRVTCFSPTVEIVRPNGAPPLPDLRAAIVQSLRHPHGTLPLNKLVNSGDRIVILLSDKTRRFPQGEILDVLLEEIGHKTRDIEVVIANGTHSPTRLCGLGLHDGILRAFTVCNHNAKERHALTKVGSIASQDRGPFFAHAYSEMREFCRCFLSNLCTVFSAFLRCDTEKLKRVIGYTILARMTMYWAASGKKKIYLNRKVHEADLVISLGQVKPHMLAGYSGGAKGIFPGASDTRSISRNHCMMVHDSVRLGRNSDNVIRIELEKAARLAGRSFCINVVLNEADETAGVFAGDIVWAQRRAADFCATLSEVVAKKADIVIVSDYSPECIDVYQITKLLPSAAHLVNPGGVIICAGPCPDGVNGKEMIINEIMYRTFLKKILPDDVLIILVSDMAVHEVAKTFYSYAGSLEEALEMACEKVGQHATVSCIPRGSLVVPLPVSIAGDDTDSRRIYTRQKKEVSTQQRGKA